MNFIMGSRDPSSAVLAVSFSSLTVRNVWLIETPFAVTVNRHSVYFPTATTPGTAKLCVYTAAGTRIIDTTLTPVAASLVSAAVSSVVVGPGQFYVAIGCATTCNNAVATDPALGTASAALYQTSVPSGKTIMTGQVTHSSGGCDSSLGTITGSSSIGSALRYRADN